MPLILKRTLSTLTLEQKQRRAKAEITNDANNLVRQMVNSYNRCITAIWKNQSGLSPQQVFDAFGTDAAELVHLTDTIKEAIKKAKPDTGDLTASTAVRSMADGTVLVGGTSSKSTAKPHALSDTKPIVGGNVKPSAKGNFDSRAESKAKPSVPSIPRPLAGRNIQPNAGIGVTLRGSNTGSTSQRNIKPNVPSGSVKPIIGKDIRTMPNSNTKPTIGNVAKPLTPSNIKQRP